MIDTLRGARVFVASDGGAVLILYRRLHRRYLLVVFQRGRAAYELVDFATLLDVMPVRTVALGRMREWPMRATLEGTVHAWLGEAREALMASAWGSEHPNVDCPDMKRRSQRR